MSGVFVISPKLKDDILEYIITNSNDMRIDGSLSEWGTQFSINSSAIEAILRQFNTREFIEYTGFMGGDFLIVIKVYAHDYYLKGGHVGEFEVIELEFKKIQKEIQSLEQQIPKVKYDIIFTGINTVIAYFSAIHK